MRKAIVALFVVLAVTLSGTVALADIEPLERPDAQGDQLVFYYDAREGFTSFLTVRNVGFDQATVSMVFYGPTFSTPFTLERTLPQGGLTIFDVGALRGTGLPAQQGVAFATAVNGMDEPIVTLGLSGSFTVANLSTSSAWGAPAPARSARNVADDSFPGLGTKIDNASVAFQTIRPFGLDLGGYFNPETLAPVSSSGNQLIFINFVDVPGDTFSATVGSTTWNVFGARADGTALDSVEFVANGVTVSDLASVMGPGVNGAAGGLRFSSFAVTAGLTRMIFFAEALGTFGTGYLLPPFPLLL